MNQYATKMSCTEFQAQLSDLISSGATIANDPHLTTCENCRALLRDLETIAEAARQLFPIEEPPDAADRDGHRTGQNSLAAALRRCQSLRD